MADALQLDAVDILVITGSLIAVFVAGVIGGRGQRMRSGSDFVLAGRSLTIPFFVASLVATWYGAVLGSGEFVMRYGITFLLCFGLPYYLVAIIYARWLASRIRNSEAVSIPDQLGRIYGPQARTISAIVMLAITIPAAYQLMLGVIVQSITGWSLVVSIVCGTVVSMVYIMKGGLRSDIYANVIQLFLMYFGFAALIVSCMSFYGSPLDLVVLLPKDHLTIPGTLGWGPIVMWFVVALQTFVDPNFHIRTAVARNGLAARHGIYISIGLWMVFDAMQLLAGLYAVAHLPHVAPTETYLALAQAVMPSLWKGLFLAGVIASVMSTLDGYALVSSTTIGHDLIDVWKKRGSRVSSMRFGLVITAVIGAVAAWLIPSIIDLMYNAASLVVPALLLPLLVSFTAWAKRFKHAIVPLIVLPAATSAISFSINLGEPMIVGLTMSILLFLFLSISREPSTIR